MGIYDKYKKLILPLTSVKTQVTTALPGVIGRTVTTGLGNEGIDLAIWINEKLQDNTIEIPGLAELIQLTGMPEGSTTLGSFNGNIIPDNSTIKQALQILETAVMGAGGGSGLNGIYTGSGDIASNVVANVTNSFSINTGASDFVKIGDINGVLSNDFNSINGIGLEINSQGYAKLGKVFSQTGYAPSLYISKEELSLVHDYNNHLTFTSTEFPVLKTDKTQFNIWGAYNNFKGLVYKADYSNNYVDRSLVDKAYVDLKSQIVADGNKGDITISNNGTVWLVNNSVLTYNKLQNTTGSKLLGRYDSTTGTIQEIALGTGLAFVNNTLVSTGGSGGILLTTNNSSGPATLNSGTLNIPNYSLTGLGGVPTTRTITINGETYDLSQNRSWTINSMIYPSAGIPVSTGSAWGTSIVNNSTNWNTAFSWGNHALAGYLTSYTETDPTVPSHVKAITTTNISNWNSAYGWGNHATQGYLTSASIDAVPTNGSANAVSSNGVFDALATKADLVSGKIPASQLPSYVDDVIEGYYNGTAFFTDAGFTIPITGETGKIYINLLNNTSYRYTGSVYVQISNTVSSLNDLTDVTIGTLNNGQILQYNGTTSQWENVSVTIGSGDMQKSVYDIDNDGVVDYAETIAVDVRNNSSSDTLYRGTIVYLSGSTGTHPNAVKAQANSEATSSGTFGVVINDISPNNSGLVAAMGTLHNLDTRTGANGNPNPFTSDTLLDGDVLWLDPNTAGYVTKTKPSAPNHAVFIGVVARTHPTSGRIVYKIQNGYEVEELHNVKITSPLLNNQVLRYTQSTGLWENKTLNFQVPLTLTTNGTSGVATLAGDGVLNIPNYSTVPGGSNTQVQFNNNGVFGGSSKFTWNGTDLLLNDDNSVSPNLAFKSNDTFSGITKYSTFKVSGSTYNIMLNSYVPSLNFSVYDTNGDYVSTPLSVTSVINTLDNTLAATTITVDGDLKINNLSTVTNTASALIGIDNSNKTFKTSLDSSTLSLSSAGVLSGVIKTLNDLTDVVVSSPTSGQVLSYNGTNWVNTTGGGGGGGGISDLNGLTASTQTFATGTTGTDFNISSSTSTHTFNLPTASATNRGLLSSANWTTFNSKIGGTGAANKVAFFTDAGTLSNNTNFHWDNTNGRLGIGTSTPQTFLEIRGTSPQYPGLRISSSSVSIPNFQGLGFNPQITTNTTSVWEQSGVTTGGASFWGFSTVNTTPPIIFNAVTGSTSGSDTNSAIIFRTFCWNGSTSSNPLTNDNILAGFSNGSAEVFNIRANGNINIGTKFIPSARLHIRGADDLSTSSALLVQNNATTPANLLDIRNNGAIFIGKNNVTTTQNTASIASEGTDANIGIAIVPKGTGAIMAAIPNGAASGGNARGTNAVDLQTLRSFANGVASGAYSVVSGGSGNSATGQGSVVAGGTGNGSSGINSFSVGGSNSASGDVSFCIGRNSIASGLDSGTFGNGHAASATSSLCMGLNARSVLYGQKSFASGPFASSGDAQTSQLTARRSITGTAAAELTLDGGTPASSNRIIINLSGATNGRIWNAIVQLSAICTTAGGTVTVGESFIGTYNLGIKRIGATTSLVGTVQNMITAQADANMSSSVVTITADDTANNECLKIEFTPPLGANASTVIRVVATVYLTEVGY